jgi:hypothetical protein
LRKKFKTERICDILNRKTCQNHDVFGFAPSIRNEPKPRCFKLLTLNQKRVKTAFWVNGNVEKAQGTGGFYIAGFKPENSTLPNWTRDMQITFYYDFVVMHVFEITLFCPVGIKYL